MRPGELKRLRADFYTLNNLHHRVAKSSLKDRLIELGGEEEHQNCVGYIDKLIARAEKKIEALPIGHRFTGKFYVKKAYTSPQESVLVKGSAFMQEDLVSWVIDGDQPQYNVSYVREIFKDKKLQHPIKREDAEPVL
jgi:hypothetical protein